MNKGITPPALSRLMGESPWPKHSLLGTGKATKVDKPGWGVSTFWTDRRFVLLHFNYFYNGVYDDEREAAGLEVLRQMSQWVADHGFVVYLVADKHHPYSLVGRIGNEPRNWQVGTDNKKVEILLGK